MSKVSVKKVQYENCGECIEITNGIVSLVVTTEFGPRVMRYGFVGGENEFGENVPFELAVGDDAWRLRGGHRLWHSPEEIPRSYMPDNVPIEWVKIENGVRVTIKEEAWTHIGKEMDITLAEDDTHAKIVHRLKNKNAWPVELAVWTISVMALGGKEIIPQVLEDTTPAPNRNIALWHSAKMNDPRFYWGSKYITVQQDPGRKSEMKIGVLNKYGWACYCNHNNLFIKRYDVYLDKKYPDFGVTYETYNSDFELEMESLSPLTILKPDEVITHIERWELIKGVKIPPDDDDLIDEMVNKYI
jgi:hypothetical protein